MSSDDEEEGLGAIVVEPLEDDLNDEDFLGDAGNFTQQIHSTRLIQDSSTGNFLAKNRFDERRLTATLLMVQLLCNFESHSCTLQVHSSILKSRQIPRLLLYSCFSHFISY